MLKKFFLVLFTFLTLLFPTGLGLANADKEIVLGDSGWDSIKFHNSVIAYIAQYGYGLQPKTLSGSSAIVYTALKRGDVDILSETWVDNISTYKDDVAKQRVVPLGLNFGDNKQGFYVPRYVIEGNPSKGIAPLAPDLKTVADLARYSQVFTDPEDPTKGRIYGAIPGWEIDKVMYKKFLYYNLDKNFHYFRPGSEANLSAAFATAISKNLPIVGYYWEPTWLTGKYDLVLIKDSPYTVDGFPEGKTEAPSVQVMIAASPAFPKKFPEFAEFLKHYHTSSALTAEALAYIADNKSSYEDAAKVFLRAHPDLVSQWLPPDKAELVTKALQGKSSQEDKTDFFSFPEAWKLHLAAPIDNGVLYITKKWGAFFDNVRTVLLFLINGTQGLLNAIPWFVLLAITALAGKKSTQKLSNGLIFAGLLFIVGLFGYWEFMMETLAVVIVSVLVSLLIGLPIGVILSKSSGSYAKIILDAMQTMPTFVYMIPAVMLLGPGKVPAVLATVVYAVVPIIRLTALGIRQVNEEVIEAARSFGTSSWQLLWKVQIPQAMPTIMTGVNQTIMMGVAMVVTCAMIGADGLGMEVLIAINRTESGRGLLAGLSIVFLAIVLDRLTQGLAKRGDK
ncbi:glycine betaine ABC transporter substrate-binding protein [Acidaminococcus provencensis]|uniref:glycine betaine ABC transporter substrate-binding protein n=1 Tax=Acidaminococcus provencensis TaxID=2058289 RepID=UPI0022E09B2B|nr:glycine betaine ABC transporter substrate-binding protein [Acidaminococcus provencensis]